ncbi:hypothetical protein WMY93_007410 [Mugilogobius chulae]|uniref:Uncharacterized protein n=1 Tax=Mugilogobius chulae TaxID=88201 RepID=A0AAW0PNK5_9GOBI
MPQHPYSYSACAKTAAAAAANGPSDAGVVGPLLPSPAPDRILVQAVPLVCGTGGINCAVGRRIASRAPGLRRGHGGLRRGLESTMNDQAAHWAHTTSLFTSLCVGLHKSTYRMKRKKRKIKKKRRRRKKKKRRKRKKNDDEEEKKKDEEDDNEDANEEDNHHEEEEDKDEGEEEEDNEDDYDEGEKEEIDDKEEEMKTKKTKR